MNTKALYISLYLIVIVPSGGALLAEPNVSSRSSEAACDRGHKSRDCPPTAAAVEGEERRVIRGRTLEFKKKISIPGPGSRRAEDACDAQFTAAYTQRNEVVKVRTTVENDTCGASHGEYELRIRTMGSTGEASTRSFQETWARHNDEPHTITRDYPMAGATDLIWVRVRSKQKTACSCDGDT